MQLDSEAIFGALGLALVEQEERGASALAAVGASLADQFAETLERRLEALPVPRDGAPGQAGLDRVLTLPRYIEPGEPFERNEIAWWNCGLWQAVRAGIGDPGHDPGGWRCLVPGIASIEAREDWSKRELVIGFRMSGGELHETRARMLPGLLPPDWEEKGIGIIAGDLIRDGEFERLALIDGAEPGCVEHWHAREIRGRRGRPGDKGETGRPGAGLTGLSLVRAAGGALAIVPAYDDPAITPEPIAVEMMIEEPADRSRRVLAAFAGRHVAGKSYARGDVVSAAPGALWLSLKPDNRKPLAEGEAWERMI